MVCIADAEREVGAGFAEWFGTPVDLGVLDEKADAGVARTEGGEAFKSSEGLFVEFIDAGLGVDFECVDEVVGGEACVGVVEHGLDETVVVGVIESKPGGHVVSSEGGEVVGAGFECGVDGEALDGAGGALADAVFALHEDGGAGEAVDESGADDADDAGVPILVREDDGSAVGVGHPRVLSHFECLFEDALFRGSPVVVE